MLLGKSATLLGITFPLGRLPSLLRERSMLSSCEILMYWRRYLSGGCGRKPYIRDKASGKWCSFGADASDASIGSGDREGYRRC